MDLNPLFTGATSFRPAGDGSGGELKLFEQADIKLVHGWLVDPDSQEHSVVSRVQDYDSAVNLIVDADVATQGRLVADEDGSQLRVSSEQHEHNWSEEQRRKVEDAIVIRNFLDTTQSQLTYYGLFHLASTLPPDSLVALFRNSHLSVLYKSSSPISSSTGKREPEPAPEPSEVADGTAGIPEASTSTTIAAHLESPSNLDPESHCYLYSLVTDFVFLHEPTVVWERLEDVEGGASTFVDSDFRPSAPAGGDFAGLSPEEAAQHDPQNYPPVDPDDQALAQRLQAEEDAHAEQMYARQQEEQRQHAERERKLREMRNKAAADRERHSAPGLKKKASCIIM